MPLYFLLLWKWGFCIFSPCGDGSFGSFFPHSCGNGSSWPVQERAFISFLYSCTSRVLFMCLSHWHVVYLGYLFCEPYELLPSRVPCGDSPCSPLREPALFAPAPNFPAVHALPSASSPSPSAPDSSRFSPFPVSSVLPYCVSAFCFPFVVAVGKPNKPLIEVSQPRRSLYWRHMAFLYANSRCTVSGRS